LIFSLVCNKKSTIDVPLVVCFFLDLIDSLYSKLKKNNDIVFYLHRMAVLVWEEKGKREGWF
jgi:hypothetical protein